jgi:hypothetical protein
VTTLTRRHRRETHGNDECEEVREYSPEEVQALTEHAEKLLSELHEVTREMARRLAALVEGEAE